MDIFVQLRPKCLRIAVRYGLTSTPADVATRLHGWAYDPRGETAELDLNPCAVT